MKKTQPKKSRNEQFTFCLKSQKETDYYYKLSNGDFLIFKDKNFPMNKPTTNQLILF